MLLLFFYIFYTFVVGVGLVIWPVCPWQEPLLANNSEWNQIYPQWCYITSTNSLMSVFCSAPPLGIPTDQTSVLIIKHWLCSCTFPTWKWERYSIMENGEIQAPAAQRPLIQFPLVLNARHLVWAILFNVVDNAYLWFIFSVYLALWIQITDYLLGIKHGVYMKNNTSLVSFLSFICIEYLIKTMVLSYATFLHINTTRTVLE